MIRTGKDLKVFCGEGAFRLSVPDPSCVHAIAVDSSRTKERIGNMDRMPAGRTYLNKTKRC